MNRLKSYFLAALSGALMAGGAAGAEDLPPSIQAPGLSAFLTLHAEGAQIHQCKPGPDGKLVWIYREPIATLLRDGVTVGRHFAGPHWRLDDGSQAQGKVVGKAPGATPADALWLKLDVTGREGQGALSEAVAIQRVHTHGGVLEGACDTDGAFRSISYSADYVFLKK
jgi:hypothetical protein